MDISPLIISIRNNSKLQWGGSAVKQKAILLNYSPIFQGSKDFVIRALIQMYENVGNTYGNKITDLISADVTLSSEEKLDLLDRYRDKEIFYTTAGKYVDNTGNLVSSDTIGATLELDYWQNFKLNNASLGMTSASTQGALDAEYKIITAIITKMDSRKNF